MNYIDQIRALDACNEATDWLQQSQHPDLQAAWNSCGRGDWMMWLVVRLDTSAPMSDERKPLVACVCECARLAWVQMPPDSRHALETVEAWTRGECDTAADAADAAYAASAADATHAAAQAAAQAADAARAAANTSYAARAAAGAAYAARAADATHVAARVAIANIVRKHYPLAPRV